MAGGWWLVRNLALYGDPTGLFALNRAFLGSTFDPAHADWPVKVQEAIRSAPFLFRSFFAMFGRYVLAADPAYAAIGVLTATGLAAGTVTLIRNREPLAPLLLGWMGLTLLEAGGYSLVSISGGRFLYPALAPLAVVAVAGWAALIRAARSPAVALIGAAAAISAACAWLVVAPAYAYPPALSQPPASAAEVNATFDGAVQLLAADGPARGFLEPGRPYDLTLYWRLLHPIDQPLSEFVHLDSDDPSYAAGSGYEGAPGKGLYPPNFWQPGQVIVDRHTFTLAPDTRPDRRNAAIVRLRAGMYYLPPLLGASPLAAASTPPGPVQVATWKLPGDLALPGGPPLAEFPQLALLAAAPRLQAGQLTVDLTWQASQPPDRDYTVFVQLLSPAGQVLAQHDSYPLDGRYRTSDWSASELVADSVALPLPGPPDPAATLAIGVYVLPDSKPVPTAAGEPFVRVPLRL